MRMLSSGGPAGRAAHLILRTQMRHQLKHVLTCCCANRVVHVGSNGSFRRTASWLQHTVEDHHWKHV